MPAVAKSPKAVTKVTKEKKPKASKTPVVRSHPPYFQMIKEAILALRERTGSSVYAIAKHVEENHKGELPANFKKLLSIQLRNCANNGKLVKVKASFKLSDEAKKAAKPVKAKKVTEKVKEKKPVKKTAASTVAKKRKAPSATTVAKPKKKVEAKAKAPKKAIVAKKVKKVAKSPVKAKKPKSIKSPGAKKARVAKA